MAQQRIVWTVLPHGRVEEAEKVIADIESRFPSLPPAHTLPRARLRARRSTPLHLVMDVLFRQHLRRTFVGLSLMASQAFFYNAIFFTYALILTDFYGIASGHVGWYILPFAIGNFLGPLLLGRLFNTRGRRPMIAFTYIVSGILLALTGWLFLRNLIDETTQTVCWMVIFFFASAAASSAYLTVSETFPLEIRALAIAKLFEEHVADAAGNEGIHDVDAGSEGSGVDTTSSRYMARQQASWPGAGLNRRCAHSQQVLNHVNGPGVEPLRLRHRSALDRHDRV